MIVERGAEGQRERERERKKPMRRQHSNIYCFTIYTQSTCTTFAKHVNTFQYTLTMTKVTAKWFEMRDAGRFVLFSSSLSAAQTHGGGYCCCCYYFGCFFRVPELGCHSIGVLCRHRLCMWVRKRYLSVWNSSEPHIDSEMASSCASWSTVQMDKKISCRCFFSLRKKNPAAAKTNRKIVESMKMNARTTATPETTCTGNDGSPNPLW